jgi:hypothetical protein
MNFIDFFAPLTMDEFKDKIFGKCSIAVTRKANPYPDLLTLEEIEQKLNDGCSSLSSIGVIGENGAKMERGLPYYKREELRWSPVALKKSFVLDKLINHHSIVMHNMTQVNRHIAELSDSIETAFPGFHTDLHIYISPRPSSTGYNVHRDTPQHKIYIQLFGTSNWTIYKGKAEAFAMPLAEAEKVLEVDFKAELTPGSAIYMPPDVFHHVVNGNGPRVSLSFPFIHDPSLIRMDRTHIPLKNIFEAATDADAQAAVGTPSALAQSNA